MGSLDDIYYPEYLYLTRSVTMGGFFSTSGRSNRQRYILELLIVSVIIGFGSAMTTSSASTTAEASPLAAVGALMMIGGVFAGIFPVVRRLHDVDMSGWWYLISLVPIANFALGLYLLFAKGTEGPNRYGPDPLQSKATRSSQEETPDTANDRSQSRSPSASQKDSPQDADFDREQKPDRPDTNTSQERLKSLLEKGAITEEEYNRLTRGEES